MARLNHHFEILYREKEKEAALPIKSGMESLATVLVENQTQSNFTCFARQSVDGGDWCGGS